MCGWSITSAEVVLHDLACGSVIYDISSSDEGHGRLASYFDLKKSERLLL